MGDAVTLVAKGLNTSRVYEPILTPDQLAALHASPDTEPFDGDGGPGSFRLASKPWGYRWRLNMTLNSRSASVWEDVRGRHSIRLPLCHVLSFGHDEPHLERHETDHGGFQSPL